MEKSTLLTLLGIGIAGAGALVTSKQESVKIEKAVNKATGQFENRMTDLEMKVAEHDNRISNVERDVASIHEAMSAWRD